MALSYIYFGLLFIGAMKLANRQKDMLPVFETSSPQMRTNTHDPRTEKTEMSAEMVRERRSSEHRVEENVKNQDFVRLAKLQFQLALPTMRMVPRRMAVMKWLGNQAQRLREKLAKIYIKVVKGLNTLGHDEVRCQ